MYKIATLQDLQRTAERFNCTLEVASPNELLLDIDEDLCSVVTFDMWKGRNAEMLILVDELFGILHYEHWTSRNGNLHVKIMLDAKLDGATAVALQAALGSDPAREIIASWERWVLPEVPRDAVEDTRSLFKPVDAVTTRVEGYTT